MPVFRVVALAFAKSLSKIFGIATITFFGRVPSRDDDKVAFVGVLSLAWVFVVVAVFVPWFAELIFPFLPDDETFLRATAILFAVLIPPVNGVVITRLHNRDGGAGEVAKHLALGFPYSAVIGLLVVGLVVVVPVVRGSYILRQFDLKHISVMINRDDYDEILGTLRDVLARNGLDTTVVDPNPAIRWLFSALVWTEGRIFRRKDLAPQMHLIRGRLPDGEWFEVILHATDLTIIGKKRETSVVAAILAEELESPKLYFSWDDDSQALEERIRDCRERLERCEPLTADDIDGLTGDLRNLELSMEEWNALRRLIYRLELDRCQTQLQTDSAERHPELR